MLIPVQEMNWLFQQFWDGVKVLITNKEELARKTRIDIYNTQIELNEIFSTLLLYELQKNTASGPRYTILL